MANPFTPEEISQILEAFFAAVGTRQYIGARYVPIFGRKDEDSIIWDNSAPYEPLTIVLYQGNSFTSRQYVPAGVEITNTEFWANTGNYNAQIEEYRRVAQGALDEARAAQNDIDTLLPKTDFSAENTVKDYIDNAVQNVQNDIDTLLPKTAFSAENTVKDYIDNGVQNDINTLLPKVAFSAENTVKDYIDNNKTRIVVFETATQMQAAMQLVDGMICKTLGYRNSGDAGGAIYIISTSGTPNNMDVLALQNDLFAQIVIENEITPEQLGAWGDGQTDDSAPINRAIELADIINFSPKTYYVGGTVGLVNANNKILNGVANATTLKFNDNTTGTSSEGYVWLFNITSCANINISGIQFDYVPTDATTVNKAVVNVARSNYITFNNCAFYSDKDESGIKNICTCVWLRGSTGTENNGNISITNCEFINHSSATEGGCLWVVSHVDSVSVDKCNISHCTADEAVAVWSTDSGTVTITNTQARLVNLAITPSQLIGAYNNGLIVISNSSLLSDTDLGALSFIRSHDMGKIVIDSCFIKCDACFNHRVFKIDVGGGEIQVNNSRVEAIAVNYINDGQRVFESQTEDAFFKISNTVFVVGKQNDGSANSYTFLASSAGRFQFSNCSFVFINPTNAKDMFFYLSGATYWQAVGNNFISEGGEVNLSGVSNLTDTASVGNQRGSIITFNQSAQTAFA